MVMSNCQIGDKNYTYTIGADMKDVLAVQANHSKLFLLVFRQLLYLMLLAHRNAVPCIARTTSFILGVIPPAFKQSSSLRKL